MFKLKCNESLNGIKTKDSRFQCEKKKWHNGLHRSRQSGIELHWYTGDRGKTQVFWNADTATVSYSHTEWSGGWESQING